MKPFLKNDEQRKPERKEVKRQAATPITVVDENFAKFTKGSESNPVPLEDDGYYIPDDLTNQPGWAGRGIAEAGGACAILYYDSDWYGTMAGFLDTPEMYLYGEATLTFKAKVLHKSEGELWVPICDAYDGPMDSKTFELTDQWQDFTFTTSGATAYDNNYFQFTPQECEILIDDVKIVVLHNKVKAPYTYAPENISLTSFRAGWESVVAPDRYILNVYSMEKPANSEQGVMFENFNNVNLNGNKIDTSNPNYPQGWKIDASDNVETGVGEGGSSVGLILNEEGQTIESADTPLPIKDFKFWVKPSNMDDEYYAYSLLQVSIYSQSGWEIIANLPNYWMNGEGGAYVFGPDAVGQGVSRIKLEYLQKGDAAVEFIVTDFDINYETGDEKVPFIDGKELDGETTTYVVEGLTPEKNYYYTVQAAIDDLVSEESYPQWVDGIVGLAPVALEATNVTENSFTACWEALPHATTYTVTVQQLTTAKEDMADVTVIEENFDKITWGTLEDPGYDFISPYDFGANGMANANWQATQPRWIEGMAGSAGTSWWGSAGIVASPALTLTNDGGEFDVEFTALSTVDNDVIFCMVLDNIDATEALDSQQLQLGAAAEKGTTKVHFGPSDVNRKNVMVAFMSKSGEMFFVDDIRVSQNLRAGEAVVSTYVSEDTSETSFNFSGLSSGSDYSYTVLGSTNKDFTAYVSESSNEILVKIATGVEKVGDAVFSYATADGAVIISGLNGGETVQLFDLQGRMIANVKARASELTLNAAQGLYLLRVDGKTVKVMVK